MKYCRWCASQISGGSFLSSQNQEDHRRKLVCCHKVDNMKEIRFLFSKCSLVFLFVHFHAAFCESIFQFHRHVHWFISQQKLQPLHFWLVNSGNQMDSNESLYFELLNCYHVLLPHHPHKIKHHIQPHLRSLACLY